METASNYNLDDEETADEPQMSLLEMSDKLTELWNDYFAAPKKKKPLIMEEYNKLAEIYNKRRGAKLMLLLTPTTKDSISTRPVKEPEVVPKHEQNESEDEILQDAPKAEPKTGSIIDQIIKLHKQGLSNKEIIAKGFNKSTVGRQVSEYKKRNNG